MVDFQDGRIYIPKNMEWARPEYSRGAVDEAGSILADSNAAFMQWDRALEIVNNWRSSHYFPLNTLQVGLRRRSREIDAQALVAQRIKRRIAIIQKLIRFDWLRLSEIQDIGGCRAVVRSVNNVMGIVSAYKKSKHRHLLIDEDNYIYNPKNSGYRSYHMIYQYNSAQYPCYNRLKIEIQLRSRLQHAWATAVETAGAFTRQALKSSMGDEDWLRFFAIMGTAIANRENTPPVPKTPSAQTELKDELRHLIEKLDIINRLNAYGAAFSVSPGKSVPNVRYRLIILDIQNRRIQVQSYRRDQFEDAIKHYSEIEEKATSQSGLDVVLVSAETLDQLRRAYPNYFVDTKAFIKAVREAIK